MPDRRCECGAVWFLRSNPARKTSGCPPGKDRMAGGSVITDAGGKVGHQPSTGADNRLAELPLRMFQRRFGYADPALAAAGGGGGIQGGIDVLKVFSRDGICDRLRRRRASLAALLCSACAFATSARAFASCARRSAPRCDRGVVDGKQYFPALTRWLSVTFNCRILPET